MIRTKFFKVALVSIILLSNVLANAQTRSKFVSTKGKNFIAPDGKILALKGIGLGNWLLPEGYMFEFKKADSPLQIYEMTNQLIGESESRKFWKSFRQLHYSRRHQIHKEIWFQFRSSSF